MKYKNFVFALVIYVSYLLVTGCHKNTGCHWAAEPYSLVLFQLYKGGQLITDSSFLSSIKLSYYQNNSKHYATAFGLLIGTDSNIFYKNGIMSLNVLSTLNIKNYYLEYPNSSWATDTLYVDYLSPSPNTNCEYKLNEIKYNGTVPNDTTIFYQPVYTLNKP